MAIDPTVTRAVNYRAFVGASVILAVGVAFSGYAIGDGRSA